MTPHSAGIALLLIAALLLQSLMPKGVMAGSSSSADGAWLVLCGEVFDLPGTDLDDIPAHTSVDAPCAFGFLTGLGVLHSSALAILATNWSIPTPPALPEANHGLQRLFHLPQSRAPPGYHA